MQTIRDLIKSKGTTVWSIAPNAVVLDALRLMAEKDIGALLVLEADRPIGLLSERDYARKVVLEGRASSDTSVRAVMVTDFPVASPTHTIAECMTHMTERRARHMPVMDGDQLLGVVSIGDLVKATIDQQQFTIEQLEGYISSS